MVKLSSLKPIHFVNMSEQSSFLEEGILLTKPFQASQVSKIALMSTGIVVFSVNEAKKLKKKPNFTLINLYKNMQCLLWMSHGNTLYNYRSGQVPLQVASASRHMIYFRTVSY